MNDTCTCGRSFLDAEDFRDHMPCPGSRQDRLSKQVDELATYLREHQYQYQAGGGASCMGCGAAAPAGGMYPDKCHKECPLAKMLEEAKWIP